MVDKLMESFIKCLILSILIAKICDAQMSSRWFAKRFLHPDVVSAYDHIFLWDEDLGVDNFNPRRYL
jgi:Protein of unknown function (DUF707)